MPNRDALHNLQGDDLILTRLRDGDELAFDTLVRIYGGALIRHATKIVGSADAAQDVVQDVFLSLWRERARVEASWDIATYLYGQTRRRAIDVARSDYTTSAREQRWALERRDDAEWDGGAHHPDEVVDDGETDTVALRARVWEALAGVPPRCREIFMFVWDRQLPYREIAHLLGLAEPTVRSQMSRAMKRLVEVLGPDYSADKSP